MMTFIDNKEKNSTGEKRKISSTLELAKKMGLIDKHQNSVNKLSETKQNGRASTDNMSLDDILNSVNNDKTMSIHTTNTMPVKENLTSHNSGEIDNILNIIGNNDGQKTEKIISPTPSTSDKKESVDILDAIDINLDNSTTLKKKENSINNKDLPNRSIDSTKEEHNSNEIDTLLNIIDSNTNSKSKPETIETKKDSEKITLDTPTENIDKIDILNIIDINLDNDSHDNQIKEEDLNSEVTPSIVNNTKQEDKDSNNIDAILNIIDSDTNTAPKPKTIDTDKETEQITPDSAPSATENKEKIDLLNLIDVNLDSDSYENKKDKESLDKEVEPTIVNTSKQEEKDSNEIESILNIIGSDDNSAQKSENINTDKEAKKNISDTPTPSSTENREQMDIVGLNGVNLDSDSEVTPSLVSNTKQEEKDSDNIDTILNIINSDTNSKSKHETIDTDKEAKKSISKAPTSSATKKEENKPVETSSITNGLNDDPSDDMSDIINLVNETSNSQSPNTPLGNISNDLNNDFLISSDELDKFFQNSNQSYSQEEPVSHIEEEIEDASHDDEETFDDFVEPQKKKRINLGSLMKISKKKKQIEIEDDLLDDEETFDGFTKPQKKKRINLGSLMKRNKEKRQIDIEDDLLDDEEITTKSKSSKSILGNLFKKNNKDSSKSKNSSNKTTKKMRLKERLSRKNREKSSLDETSEIESEESSLDEHSNNTEAPSQNGLDDFNPKDAIIENRLSRGNMNFYPFEFRGVSWEFFKIWIVNIALTLLTLGVYSAWAKVRTNRYIYGNTFLANSNFEFNADPKRILIGRAIIVAFYGVFYFTTKVSYNMKLAGGVAILFLILLPWLMRQAINFKLKSASYRNIHFKFYGKTRSFYLFALFAIAMLALSISPLIASKYLAKTMGKEIIDIFALLYVILLGISIPIIYKKFKDLVINNSAYGTTKFSFSASKRSAVWLFIKMWLLSGLVGGVLFAIGISLTTMLGSSMHLNSNNIFENYLPMLPFLLFYLMAIGFYKGINDAFLSNYTRNNTKLGDGEFQSEISPLKLGFISATNTLAIILSAGLLYPWAKMRYLRYKISQTSFGVRNMNQFISSGRDNPSAIGEEAMDFFDIDIGV